MKITIQNVLDAIKLGGYPQGREHVIEWCGDIEFEGDIKDADAIGVAALNLGISPQGLLNTLYEVIARKNSTESLAGLLISLNDTKQLDFGGIYAQTTLKYKAKLKSVVEVKEQDYSKVTNYQGKKI
jgi:hypothetical protein